MAMTAKSKVHAPGDRHAATVDCLVAVIAAGLGATGLEATGTEFSIAGCATGVGYGRVIC